MIFLRSNNLVYVGIRKNASTFYTNYFKQQLKWSEINASDVDWENDIVFSHISDPMDRHIKGIAQAISIEPLISDIFNDQKFSQLFGFSVVDCHCVPIYCMLGRNTEKIDWILLDSEISSEQLTRKFLNKHNIESNLEYEEFRFRNSNKIQSAKIRDRLKSLIESYKDNETLKLFYEQDKILYNNVKSRFNKFIGDATKKYGSNILNPDDNKKAWSKVSWDEISWLRHE